MLQNGPFTNNLVSKDPDNIEEADIYEASRRIKQFQEELDHLNDSVGKVEDDLSGFSSSEQAVQTKEMMQVKQMIDALKQVWKTAEEWYKFFVESGKIQLKQLE